MEKKRIVWIDDDVFSPILGPYIDELEENNFEVIKINEVNGLLPILKKEAENELSAILVDIIMPPQHLDFGETRGGLRTGTVVIKDILNNEFLNKIPIIVVTNVDDARVNNFCENNSIPYIVKTALFSDEFVDRINSEINNFKSPKNKDL